ncbi:hypothetical protein V496_07226 [Pseudogymnoascus sp. VKM F-4515 (FW-2607)]|nr:hypothetical protein V496_07226 [Pseudogymnoascus sp. VKM F-4515 (FW-2607)]
MVKITTIRECNERLAKENNADLVCVFAGATSGSGAGALEAMVDKINPSCKLEFLEAQVSLLSDVDRVCRQIAAAEKKVDLLYMSPGCIPFGGPRYTKEGIETSFSISYYSRMRLIQNLLPLLRKSTRPRVLTLLNGGKEKPMFEDDIGLEKRWSAEAVIAHTTTMTSLALEHLSKDDERITFLHVFPGLVNSGNFIRVNAAESAGVFWRVMLTVFCRMITAVQLIFGITPEECGERQAYHLTSEQFGPGAWRIGNSSEAVSAHVGGVFETYRDDGWSEMIWKHTTAVFESALATRTDREM